jgi:drug/metabolite transporter (DMT)-like permease
MPPSADGDRHQPLRGILFMCGASTLFPVMNGMVQVLSARYSTEQLVWARCLAHLLFIAVLFAPRYGVRLLATSVPKWQFLRSMVLLASTLCFFTGVKYLPLAEAASISFTAPFIVALLAWPILGERIGLSRLVAITVGFAGVLVVIRPGGENFHWASLILVANATFYGLYQIFTRRVAGIDPAETSAAYSVLIGTIVMTLLMPLFWTPIASWQDALMMAGLGVLGGLGHLFVVKAMFYAPANIVAPFMYWQIVGAVGVGYIVTGKLPDAYVWLGAAIIVAAGLAIGWMETRRKPA